MKQQSVLKPDSLQRRVIARAIPNRAARTPGILLGILADGCVVGLLALSMWLIIRSAEQPPILYLNFAIVGVRALAIGRAAFRYVERLASHNAAFSQLANLRAETFTALIPRVPGAIEEKRRGEVLAGFIDDVDQLQDEQLRVRQPLIVSTTVTVLSLILVAVISPAAAVVTAICLALTAVLAIWVTDRISGETEKELAASRAALTDAILERAENSETLAAFNGFARQRALIEKAQTRLAEIQSRAAITAGLTAALLGLGQGIATLLVLYFAAIPFDNGVSAAAFGLIVIVPAAIAEVFVQAPTALAARRRVMTSAERIADLTEKPLPEQIPQLPSDLAVPGEAGDAKLIAGAPLLEIRQLSVTHAGSRDPQITDLNLTVAPGETVVITGESGSGKSTLALALVRLLDYQGSYRIGGVEAKELGAARVRQLVGLCEQRPHIFDADLRQNLKFAKPSASDAELLRVLDRVGLGEWVCQRGGLDTRLGQAGSLISGGQAQRIALARALLADWRVMIFDEPTAGVDYDLAQQLVTDLIAAVPADRAVILITHTDIPAELSVKTIEIESHTVR